MSLSGDGARSQSLLKVGKGQNLTNLPPSLQKKKIYRCPWEGCGKESPRKYNINVHMRIHTGEAPYVCRYRGCGQRFKWKSSVGNHERGHLTGSEGGHYEDRVEPTTRSSIGSTSTGHAVRRSPSENSGFHSPSAPKELTPLDAPILTVSELDNVLGETAEDSSYHSLLSFDLSHEDLSAVSGMISRFSLGEPPGTEEVSSHALNRMVLGEHHNEHQWR